MLVYTAHKWECGERRAGWGRTYLSRKSIEMPKLAAIFESPTTR